jgi:hypothetical protein
MGWSTLSPWKPVEGTGQNVTIGSASVQATNAFGDYTLAVQVSATGDCHIAFGPNPTALATSTLVKSTDGPMQYNVAPGDKIAVIRDASGSGTLNVVELSH